MEKRTINLAAHSFSSVSSSAIDRMIGYLNAPDITAADLEARYLPIYELVGAPLDDTFVFTSSAAEGINQLFWSVFLEVARKQGKCHFIASTIEDAPTMQMLKRLEDLGCFVKFVPVNEQGLIDLEELAKLITPRTALISVTVAHGLTGVIQPVEEIAILAQQNGVLLHLEASYALGKYDLSTLRPDYLTFSGERLHAPKNSAGLFVKKGAPLSPLILGGADQAGLRGGSFDLPSFMALSGAAAQASLNSDAISLEMVRLRDLLETELQTQIPEAKVLFKDVLRLPNTTTILFPGSHQEALLYLLEKKGIFASIGGKYFQHLHRVLSPCKVEGERAISFSIDRMTTEADIIRAASLIAQEVRNLRMLSEDL